MKKKILFVFGTRPEAIKIIPLIKEMSRVDNFEIKICVTGQHKEMLDQVLNFFSVQPDYDLKLMRPNQTLSEISISVLSEIQKIVRFDFLPDYIIVQGDTTTAMAAALAAFHEKIKIIHLEAGLRSFDNSSPFPEEGNRKIISTLADLHFAPTELAVQNLLKENIPAHKILNVGNTVIDALFMGLKIIEEKSADELNKHFDFLHADKKIILFTGHRRENFGPPFIEICIALKNISIRNPDVQIVYPVHLNPNIKNTVYTILQGIPNIHLIDPLSYSHLIWLMKLSYIVITDSGGIQEEAPSLGKPVLVTRTVTERTEGILVGTAKLVGTSAPTIEYECQQLLENPEKYESMSKAVNPYGDGQASKRIVQYFTVDLNK